MKSNSIILILIFFVIGLVLYNVNKSRSESSYLDKFKDSFSKTEEKQSTSDSNPYKAKEKDIKIEGNVKEKIEEIAKEQTDDFFGIIKDKIFNNSEKSEIENQLDLSKYYPESSIKYEIVKHKAFVLGYAEKHEQSAWTLHVLKKNYILGSASRNDLEFLPDRKVSTNSALSSDYSRSGYDRGHLVPAGDFKCCQDLLEDTFWVSNLSPQDQDFNRNIWNNLEQYVRNKAKKYQCIIVLTGPVLKNNLPKIGRYNKISVPEYFYKIVFIEDGNGLGQMKAQAFLIPNKSGLGYDFKTYQTSVDEIERLTQLDFFSFLPNEIEYEMEARTSTKL